MPRFYLEWFAVPVAGSTTRMFWVYDKDSAEPRRQTPINTAVEAHFYDLEHDGVRVPVEEMLGEQESQAKPVLERWGQGEMVPDDIPTLARFLSGMYVRVPRNLVAMKEHGEMLARVMLRASADDPDEELAATIKGSGVQGITVPELRELYRTTEYTPRVPEGFWLAESLHQRPVVEACLLSLHWSVCTAPPGASFITSDTPLCTFAWVGHKTALFGGGLRLPGAEVTFPLNPTKCLFLTPWLKPERLPMLTRWVTRINRRTAHIAERFVIASIRSARTDALVEASRVSRGLPKIDKDVIAQRWATAKRRSRKD